MFCLVFACLLVVLAKPHGLPNFSKCNLNTTGEHRRQLCHQRESLEANCQPVADDVQILDVRSNLRHKQFLP